MAMVLVAFAFAIAQASAVLDSRQQGGSGLHGASALVQLGSTGVALQDVAPVTSVHQVPMHDGTKLNTIVNLPANYKPGDKLATVLIRTPYNAKDLMDEAPSWCGLGFALVCQDVRGMYASEGEFRMFHDTGYDGHDTVEWITNQPWSNGRVGQTGASALALATYLLLTSHNPPAPVGLQAVAPIVGNAVMHKASFQGGAWRESLIAGWLDAQKGGSVWIPREKAHESFDAYCENTSAYWKVGGIDGFSRARAAAVPGVHMAGWYDIFSWSQIETVHQLNGSWPLPVEPPTASAPQWLIMVPGGHCGGGATNWTNVSWGSQIFSQQMKTLFELQLTDPEASAKAALQHRLDSMPRVTFYVNGPGTKGSLGNYWVQRHSFPEPGMQALYAAEGGNLQWAQPDSCDGAGACIQNFTYDPANPVQTWGGNNLVATYTHKCGPQDQRKVEDGRSDVLQYAQVPQTEPLAIVGNVTVSLFVGSDRPDTDFVAKLVDIHPDGTRMLVQDGIVRMRWRDGPLAGTTAPPLDPKQVYAVTLMIGQVSHIFNVGHKIGLTITSSNFPRFSANPNTGLPLNESTAWPVYKANQRVYVGAQGFATAVNLPTVDMSELPRA